MDFLKDDKERDRNILSLAEKLIDILGKYSMNSTILTINRFQIIARKRELELEERKTLAQIKYSENIFARCCACILLKAYGLSGKEIVIGIEDQNYQREEKVTDKVLYDLFGWLYIGKFNPNKKEFESSNILKDTNYQYRIKEIHTQNVFGKFVPEDAGEGCEDTVIFSDEYFDKQWKKQAADDEEVSMLEVFSFPKTKEQMAWKEIKDHADKEGITVFQPDDSHSSHAICYNKTVFLKEQKISNIFLLFSKLFILITLLISGVFIMVVKNLAEMSSYQRRYEFFHSMGMKQKEQKKNLSFEICSVGNIALGTGICLALLYVMTYSHWYEAMGEKISTAFWSYWLKLVGIYIIIQIVVQKLFVRYVNKRI